MGKITFDKPKLLSPVRLAFGAAAVGIAAAWWFGKSNYEPVRLLTPEEQTALSKDPARYPAPKNWEDSFITEKVPGEDRAQESNEWVQAAAEVKHSPNDPWAPRDETEKKICDLRTLEDYRSARKAWAAYQARPATAKERYDLLTEIYYTLYAAEITGLDRNQLSRVYVDTAKAAFEEARMPIVPTDAIEAQSHYGRMLSYFNVSQYSWRRMEENENFMFNASKGRLETEMGLLFDKSRDQRIDNFIKLYRQGIKPGIEGIKQFEQIADGVSIDIYLWKEVLEESDPDYEMFMKYRERWGLSLDEAKGIAAFLNRMYDFLEEKHKQTQAEAERFRNTRAPESCQPLMR